MKKKYRKSSKTNAKTVKQNLEIEIRNISKKESEKMWRGNF